MNMIKFAALVSWLQWSIGANEKYLVAEDIEILQDRINNLFDKQSDRPTVPENLVNDLLAVMGHDGKKIEAIKAYRMITNAGLRESKDAVEKYWPINVRHELINKMAFALKGLSLDGNFSTAEMIIIENYIKSFR